jgi:transcriptional regulator with XRE-family HTH domain
MDPVETGRRVKAAVAYGNLDRKQAAGILGISVETLNRIYRGLSEPPARLLPQLARKCELPPTFFTVDFASTSDASDLGARVLNLETQTASLVRSIDRVHERFTRLDERLRLVEARGLADEAEGLARSEGSSSATVRPRRQQRR